jgi:hypothetical protein
MLLQISISLQPNAFLRIPQRHLDHGLFYTPGPISLSAFSDADWAGDPNDRRSTSGLLVFLGHNPITWSAKKQLTVSRSSTEAEYRALASASAELCWLRTLVKDLGLYLYDPPILWCDNVSALAIASNPVFHARTKHIEVDFHFIRERVLRKDLQVKFVSTVDQLADIFTKGLLFSSFQDLQSKLLVPVDTICLRGDDEVLFLYDQFFFFLFMFLPTKKKKKKKKKTKVKLWSSTSKPR